MLAWAYDSVVTVMLFQHCVVRASTRLDRLMVRRTALNEKSLHLFYRALAA